jgi:hypothetical protein
MAHVLRAIIGPKAVVALLARHWVNSRIVVLPQDFLLVPMTDQLHDDIVQLAQILRPTRFAEFMLLSPGVELVLLDASRSGPIGYVETDYFGGIGSQSAIAWSNNEILCGPFQTKSKWENNEVVHTPSGDRAINRILAAMGVWTRGSIDHFDMLELGRLRSTDSALQRSIQRI